MSDACCGPAAAQSDARQTRALKIVFGVNIALFTLMVAASILSGSTSVLSASLDNLGDALTYALSLVVMHRSDRAKAWVALFKGVLILSAAGFVIYDVIDNVLSASVPVVGLMTIASAINLAANGYCLWLLTPFRKGDINLSSAWECSRNDVAQGIGVMITAGAVWWFKSGWPDVTVGALLVVLFLWSGLKVIRQALAALRAGD